MSAEEFSQFWEIYVKDFDASIAFYTKALGFEVIRRHEDFVDLELGAVKLHLNDQEYWPLDTKPVGGVVGWGVEFVLVSEAIEAAYSRAQGSGYELASELEKQEWGKTDFRVLDPDGYYIRITTPRYADNSF